MKKVEMIKTIQLAEAKAWLELKESQVKNGKLNSTTRDLKEEWMTLKCLMNALDIESDVELEESKIALNIMLENFRSTFF